MSTYRYDPSDDRHPVVGLYEDAITHSSTGGGRAFRNGYDMSIVGNSLHPDHSERHGVIKQRTDDDEVRLAMRRAGLL